MTIEVDKITAPAFMASALVNGDTSGLTEEDFKAVCRFQDKIAPWYVVDVTRDSTGEPHEERFTWHYRMYDGDADGGSVIDYVVHRVVCPGL